MKILSMCIAALEGRRRIYLHQHRQCIRRAVRAYRLPYLVTGRDKLIVRKFDRLGRSTVVSGQILADLQ